MRLALVALLAGCSDGATFARCSLLCGAGGACPSGQSCNPDDRYCHAPDDDTLCTQPDAPSVSFDAGTCGNGVDDSGETCLRTWEVLVGEIPVDLAVGRFGGSGIPEVAVAVQEQPGVLLYEAGALPLVRGQDIPVPGPVVALYADRGADADDLLVASASGWVTLVRGGPDAQTLNAVAAEPIDVAVGSCDGDPARDVFVLGRGRIGIYEDQGSALTPLATIDLDPARLPNSFVVGDGSGDGQSDVLIADDEAALTAQLNEGACAFMSYPLAFQARLVRRGEIAIGPVVLALTEGTLEVYESVLSSPSTLDVGGTPIDAVSFDQDGDQGNEIAVLMASGDVAIVRTDGQTLVSGPRLHVDGATAIAAGDLDLDGRDDLVFAQPVTRTLAVLVWDP